MQDFLRPIFFKILQYGSLNFGYRPEMVLREVADMYIEAYEIVTTGPKRKILKKFGLRNS